MDQTELTPALERVAASVVETNRKRQQVEDELRAASAAVASLHAQSSSLEASVVALRRELEQAVLVREQEDQALSELATRRQDAVEQLAAIGREIQNFLSDKERASNEMATLTQSARSRVQAVEGEVTAVKSALTALTSDTGALRDKLASIRKTADVAENQIGDVQSKSRELDGAVDAIAAKVCSIADKLSEADRDRQRVASVADEMRSVSSALESRKAEVAKAATEMSKLLAEKEHQTKALAQQIERLSQLTPGASADTGQPPIQSAPAMGERRSRERRSASQREYKFARTIDLTGVLVPLGFIGQDEAGSVLDILQEGDVDKFVRAFWSRAMGGPLPGPYRLIIGSALSEAGDHKGAMTFFNKALEGRHVDPFMTYLVAVALLQLKRYVDVLRLSQVLGRAKNGRVLSRNLEALHSAASARFDEAEKKLVEALNIPGHPRLHYQETMYNLARLAEERGDSAAAASWFEKLAAADASFRNVAGHMESLKTEAAQA